MLAAVRHARALGSTHVRRAVHTTTALLSPGDDQDMYG